MSTFVSGNLGTYTLEVGGTVLFGQFAHVTVGYFGGPLLEGRVEEAAVGVLARSGVESGGDEVLDGDFDGAHVALAREVEVFVEEVSVAVFFGGPAARPAGPGAVGGADGVVAALEGVEQGLVGGQGFFGDHVSDEDHEEVVRDAGGCLAERLDGVHVVVDG